MAAMDYEDDAAFGPDGLLRDGHKTRVSMMMRDAAFSRDAARQLDGARHQLFMPIVVDRSAARAVYEEEKRLAMDACKMLPETADGRRKHKMTTRDPRGRETGSAEWEEEDSRANDGQNPKEVAYREMVEDMENAWRNAPPMLTADIGTGQPRGQKPGDQCTINGAPGHLNAKLVCVPDRQEDGRPRTMDAAEAKRIKDEAWNEMVAEMENAWKGTAG